MKVWLPLEKEEREVKGVKTVCQLLNRFSLTEEEVLVVDKADAKLLTSDEGLKEEMEIKIVRVLSGG